MFRITYRPAGLLLSAWLLVLAPMLFGQSRPPVILVEGACSPTSTSRPSFGNLETYLNAQGIRTKHFCATSVQPKYGNQYATLEELGDALAAIIDEMGEPQVDLIPFSMGAYVVRCYLTGKQLTPGAFNPPSEPKVRKVVFLAPGFFGGPVSDPSTTDLSIRALDYGSRLQWDLATWNQHHDDLRQVDAVALVGDMDGTGTDGVLMTTSGSLLFAYPSERTRIIAARHTRTPGMLGIAYVSTDQHPAWLVVNSFLSGTDDWKNVGHSPQEDSVLAEFGGVMVAVKDAQDNLIQNVQLQMGNTPVSKGVAPDTVGTFVQDTVRKGDYNLHATAAFTVPDRSLTVVPGTFTVVTMKPGPLITAVAPAESGTESQSIPAGTLISISGERLGTSAIAAETPYPTLLGSTSVNVNQQPIPLMYVSETLIKAQLPDNIIGFVRLTVMTGEGTHSFNFFMGPPAPGKRSVTLTLSDGGANSTSTYGPSGEMKAGYSTLNVNSGSAPYGTAVFAFKQNGVTVTEAGVPASVPTTRARIFIDYRTGVNAVPARSEAGAIDINTGMAVVNNGSAAAEVTYTLRDTSGAPIAIGHGPIEAGKYFACFIDQLKDHAPDFSLPSNFPAAIQFGSLEIAGTQPLSVLALRGTMNQRDDFLITTTPVADLSQTPGTTPVYFPQFVDGGGYTTSLILLNTSDVTETGKLEMLDGDGKPFTVTRFGGTTDSVFQYSIQPGGVFRFQTDGFPGDTKGGWVRLIPDAGTSTPVGSGVFGYNPNSILLSESGIPAATSTTNARIYVDLSRNHNTGLALANVAGTAASIRIEAYQTDGVTVVGTSQGPIPLAADGYRAAFADQFIAGLPAEFTGLLHVSSDTPFAALTLRSLTNERDDFLMTTFPIADATRAAASPVVFPQVAAGAGYVTEIILLSAGQAANATLNYYDGNGAPADLGK